LSSEEATGAAEEAGPFNDELGAGPGAISTMDAIFSRDEPELRQCTAGANAHSAPQVPTASIVRASIARPSARQKDATRRWIHTSKPIRSKLRGKRRRAHAHRDQAVSGVLGRRAL
jgi:hypothetical protein